MVEGNGRLMKIVFTVLQMVTEIMVAKQRIMKSTHLIGKRRKDPVEYN